MKRILFFLLVLHPLLGQNLILNPSFESFDSCTNFVGNIDVTSNWLSGNNGSPDFYTTCNGNWVGVPLNQIGYQPAFDSLSYVGIGFTDISNYRESIIGQISPKLETGHYYCIEFYLNVGNISEYIVQNLSMHFMKNMVNPSDFMFNNNALIPQVNVDISSFQDTVIWQRFEGEFLSIEDEEFVIISNFFDDPQWVKFNNTISNTFKIAYYNIDNISITECLKPIYIIPGGFSPNNDGINDVFEIQNLDAYSNNQLTIINRWGDVVYKASPYANNWDGVSNTGMNITNGVVTDGTYFYVFIPAPGELPVKGSVEVRRNN